MAAVIYSGGEMRNVNVGTEEQGSVVFWPWEGCFPILEAREEFPEVGQPGGCYGWSGFSSLCWAAGSRPWGVQGAVCPQPGAL